MATITGRCLCERVRYEVSAPLLDAEYCHCKRCQRRTGAAASASAEAAPGSFRIVAGEELVRAFEPDHGWQDHFCAECGSHLFAQSPDDPARVCVSMGTIDDDPGVRPEYRQYVAYAAVWEPLPDDGLPRYDEAVARAT